MKKTLLLTALAMCLVLVGSANANLLVNPDFEDDLNTDDVPDGWTFDNTGYYGGTTWLTYVEDDAAGAYSGDDYLDMGSDGASGAWDGYSIAYQDVAGSAGVEYFLSVYVAADPAVTASKVELKFEFYNDVPPSDLTAISKTAIEQSFTRDGAYHLVSASMTAPAGTVIVRPGLVCIGFSPGGSILYDDAWFDTVSRPAGAHTPNPSNGAVVSPDLDQLSWVEPKPVTPSDPITNDVWFTDNYPEFGLYPGDPNFTNYATKIVTAQDACSVTLSTLIPAIDIVADKSYYWKVDCNDVEASVFLEGSVWTFNTLNQGPEVDCEVNQTVWMSAGSATATISAVVGDDGNPDPPNESAYTWSSNPAAQSISSASGTFVGSDVLSTDVTFNAPGTYEITCTVDDSVLVALDTTKVFVVAEGETGLVAYWPFDSDFDDASGNGHHGTAQGNAQIDSAEAQVGAGSLVVDGDGDYIDCGGGTTDPNFPTWASPLLVDDNVMTVSLWAKSNGDFDDNWLGLIHKDTYEWIIQRNGANDYVEFVIGGVSVLTSESDHTIDKIDDGKWHHLGGVVAGDMIYFYVDGILANSTEMAAPVAIEVMHDLWIGKAYNATYPTATYEFNGWIDEVRLSNIALPAEKILEEFVNDGGSHSCGGVYAITDTNQDCYHDLGDLANLASVWLDCTDVTNPTCVSP